MSFLDNQLPCTISNKPGSFSLWKPSDTYELYKQNLKKHKTKILYGPSDIKYKLNNNGFRCDEFTTWQNIPRRVLFIGCSHTEGIGLPLKEVWAYKFLNLIRKNFNLKIPYWNLSVGGIGNDQVVRLLYHYTPILKPHIVVSLLPELSRREREVGEMWNVRDELNYEDRFFISKEYIDYQSEKNMVMIDLLMEQMNSIFLFSPSDFEPLVLDYSFFSHIKEYNFSCSVKDYARDLKHWGPETHTFIAESMYNGFLKEISKRLSYGKK